MLTVDGAYTIDGYYFNKYGTAYEHGNAMHIVNGQGLMFVGATGTGQSYKVNYSPVLQFVLQSNIPTYYYGMPIRVWAYWSTDNCSVNGDGMFVMVGNCTGAANPSPIRMAQKIIANSSPQTHFECSVPLAATQPISTFDANWATNNVTLIESYDESASAIARFGTYNNGFPLVSSMNTVYQGVGFEYTCMYLLSGQSNINPINTMFAGIGVSGSVSNTAISITCARMRVDYMAR